MMKKTLTYLVFALLFVGCSKDDPKPLPLSNTENILVNLITPVNGALLDNGCLDNSDLMECYFDWEDLPSAQKYHLYVIGAKAQNPIIDNDSIQTSDYLWSQQGGYITSNNANDWTWKVRAFINNKWIEWAESRTFDVEPLNTDC